MIYKVIAKYTTTKELTVSTKDISHIYEALWNCDILDSRLVDEDTQSPTIVEVEEYEHSTTSRLDD